MDLSRSIGSKWQNRYVVREVWFDPGIAKTWIYALATPQDGEKGASAVPLEIPFSIVEVKDGPTDQKPTLEVYHQNEHGERMDAYSSGSYNRNVMTRAVFTLPPDMKLFVPPSAERNGERR